MSTRLQLPTVDCDGCGLAVLECMGDGVEAALQECGWVQIPDKAWHLCPVCRPDSPFEAVKRVLALADMMDKDTDVYTRALAASIRNTVTGGSDD